MKKIIFLILSIIFSAPLFSGENTRSVLEYKENLGQWENQVLFKADLHGGWVFLEKNEATFMFLEKSNHHHGPTKYLVTEDGKIPNPDYTTNENEHITKGHVYKTKWLNSNSNVQISTTEKQDAYSNYFIGNDYSKWKSNVSSYGKVIYQNLYQNIDLIIYSEATSMKSDYILRKNAQLSDIKIQYEGTEALQLDEKGNLKITTSINTVTEFTPYAYQIVDGKKIEIPCTYILSNNILSFNCPEGYNKETELIIDPTLVFSTYSGSFTDNWGSSATHDVNGNMFLGGISLGSGYPTTVGAFQTIYGGGTGFSSTDVVITKFASNGTSRIYSTYLGGSSNEILTSLNSTASNELICLISTSSLNFPTSANAYDKTHNGGSSTAAIQSDISFPNGSDIAIVKLNATGSALIGSTYFGGSGDDGLNKASVLEFNYGDDSRGDIAIDDDGNIYIVSTTNSSNIPGTSGKAQPAYAGNFDGVVAKFNSNLSSLSWATYYGGTDEDAAYSLSLDKNNNIIFCGGTTSNNIPGTSNGLNASYKGGISDGYVAKLNNNGTSILVSTYIGTSSYDQAYLLDIDNNDNVYLFGQTLGAYPVSANVYSNAGAKQFIHKLNNNLNTSSFSTVFGRTNYSFTNISPTAFLIDVCGNIYASGWGGIINSSFQIDAGTTGNMPVTTDAFKSTTDGNDFYLINLSANASSLIYATYFGETGGIGDHVDGGTSRFDKAGIVYQAVCASCGSTNSFPTTQGAYSNNNNSDNCNMAGFKFKFDLTGLQIITTSATPSSGCSPLTTTFNYTSTSPGTEYFWDFGDGTTSTTRYPNHTYSNPGTYTVRFILSDSTNCNPTDSSTLKITVTQSVSTTLNRTLCQGQTITIGNETFGNTGTFTITFLNNQGCDSIVILNLTVTPSIISNLNRTICSGESYIVGNSVYTQTGNYSDTLRSTPGCDSIINLNLIVNPNKTTLLNDTICEGQKITIGTQQFTNSGTYIVSLKTSAGCDSIVTLNLKVNPVKSTSLDSIVCQGETVTVGNQTFSLTGNYTVILKTSLGCDSTVSLKLQVNPSYDDTIFQEICDGYSVEYGNQIFNATGSYLIPLRTTLGCDSTIRLNLKVEPIFIKNLDITICEGETYTVLNSTYSVSGNYVDSTKALTGGCDSIINLKLTVISKSRESIDSTICRGESILFGNTNYSNPGSYNDTIKSVFGCDSLIVTLNLFVNELPVINAITDKSEALKNEQIQLDVITTELLSYNWQPTENVSDPTLQNPLATITSTTWFIVTATNPETNCLITDSVLVNLGKIFCSKDNIFVPNAFSPNNDGVNDIFIARAPEFVTYSMVVYDRWGNKVFESSDQIRGWNGDYKGSAAPAEVYGYSFSGSCEEGGIIIKKGNVTLIR